MVAEVATVATAWVVMDERWSGDPVHATARGGVAGAALSLVALWAREGNSNEIRMDTGRVYALSEAGFRRK